MRMKRIWVMFCVGVLAVSLLAGCGFSGEMAESPENPAVGDTIAGGSTQDEGNTQEITPEPVDWMQGGYQMPKWLKDTKSYSCLDTYTLDIPEPEFAYAGKSRQYTSQGVNFYVLDRYAMDEEEDENTQWRYQLYWIDGDTGQTRVITPFWEEQGMNEYVCVINAVGDHRLALISGDKWLGIGYKLMLWDLESGENHTWDMTQFNESLNLGAIWMDAQGYIYAKGWSENVFYVIGEKDIQGQLELLRTIKVDGDELTGLYCRMPDGTPLVYMDGKLVYVDMDAGTEKELASVTGFKDEGYIDEKGLLYINWYDRIYAYNPATDDYNIIVELDDYGVRPPGERRVSIDGQNAILAGDLRIGVNKAGELMMLVEKDGKLMIYSFGPEPRETEATLRLANLWYNDSDVRSAAILYSAEHPDCQVAYESDWANEEGFYERIMAQMAVGEGPDLLYVHGEDMDRLSARGLLADLGGVLEEDTRRQLYAGVMTAGIRDGKLAGLPASVIGVSMVTVDDNWPGDTWTLSEVVELWQQRKGQGVWRFLPQRRSQEEMLNYLVLSDMSNSPFMDWENGTCDFENDLFRQVLQMIGERPVREHTNLDEDEEYETARQVMDGVYLADVVYGDISTYATWMEYYGGKAHLVGLPSESGNGNMLKCYGFLVVNARTEHWEEAVDFLRYMYSKEFQKINPQYLVRKDVLREKMTAEDQAEGDKSSYVDEYIAFMDKCRAETRDTTDIVNIIREEAGAYFQNIQDVDNTVRVIQSRVQLYLKENS